MAGVRPLRRPLALPGARLPAARQRVPACYINDAAKAEFGEIYLDVLVGFDRLSIAPYLDIDRNKPQSVTAATTSPC